MHDANLAATNRARRRVRLGLVKIDCVGRDEALDLISGFVAEGSTRLVMTPNLDHLVLAKDVAEFNSAYQRADLVLADGMPIVLLCRLLRLPIRERVSGSDLLVPLMQRFAVAQTKVFLLGATDEVSAESAAALERHAPGLAIVGRSSPRFDAAGDNAEVDAAVDQIRDSGAEFVVVAFGSPKEGQLMHRYLGVLPPATYACLGASLDFVAGKVRRCPSWMSSMGLEWLYRLMQEPGRMWRRYLVRDMRALPMLLGLAMRRLSRRPVVEVTES